jgi:hypothetical protein
MTSKLRLLIFICTTIFLVSCTKKDEHKTINMVCTGKTTFVQEYSNGRYTKRDTEFSLSELVGESIDSNNLQNHLVLFLSNCDHRVLQLPKDSKPRRTISFDTFN